MSNTNPVWMVEVDVGRDATFGGANADITGYVMAMQWTNGMSAPEQEVAPPALLRLTLDNSGGDFSPANTESAYYGKLARGTLVRVRAVWDGTTYTFYVGKIDSLRVSTKPDIVTLECEDGAESVYRMAWDAPLLLNTPVDAALRPLFTQPAAVWPYASDYWLLGVAGESELGQAAVLGIDDNVQFEAAQTVLAYVGDGISGGAAGDFIRGVVAAEGGGRFWRDTRDAQWKFHSRHHDTLVDTSATFNGAEIETGEYEAGEITNHVTVRYQPREARAAGSIIWTCSATPLRLEAGEQRRLTATYGDPDEPDAQMSAINIIAPQSVTDFRANDASDGGGSNRTHHLAVEGTYGARRAHLRLRNTSASALYVTFLQLRGTPIVRYASGGEEAVRYDAESIAAYDRHERTLVIPAISEGAFAEDYAALLAHRDSDAIPRFRSITLVVDPEQPELVTRILARRIGQRIRVVVDALAHDAEYAIVGEQHTVTAGGAPRHRVTWILLPAARGVFWSLSDGTLFTATSELGVSTRLAM